METETKLRGAEYELLSLILPEGILDYFEIQGVLSKPKGYEVLLEEKPTIPAEFKLEPMRCHGFYPKQTIHDFPIRGKVFDLAINRRRWLNTDTKQVVNRDWNLIAEGTRFTQEFATFLKGLSGYPSNK